MNVTLRFRLSTDFSLAQRVYCVPSFLSSFCRPRSSIDRHRFCLRARHVLRILLASDPSDSTRAPRKISLFVSLLVHTTASQPRGTEQREGKKRSVMGMFRLHSKFKISAMSKYSVVPGTNPQDSEEAKSTGECHHFGRIPAFFFAYCPLPLAPLASCICLNFFFA